MDKYRIAPAEQIMCDFLLAKGGKGIPTPTVTTVLKEKVDVAALTYAVDAALSFHPFFATRLAREDYTFYWQKNSRTPIISEKQVFEGFTFGDRSSNFFPWVVTYFDHSIYFDYSHELTDAGGACTFCATLLEYYARYLDGDMSPIAEKGSREERLEDESSLPSDVAYRQGVQPLYQPKIENASSFCPEMMGENSNVRRLCIDSKALSKISFSYDASPFALVATALARASMPYLTGEHKIAKLWISQNLRGYFDNSSLHSFSTAYPFYYFEDKMKKMSVELVSTIFRGRLDLLSDISNIEAFYTSAHEMGEHLHLPEVRTQAKKAFIEQVFQQTTVAYSHLKSTGISENASKNISDVYFNVNGTGGMIGCFGLNYDDHVNMTVGTHFLDDAFFESVCSQLNELGIGCSMQAPDVRGERTFIFCEDADC
ncbi:MAG: hypothetical protein RR436_04135 [Clostridia bacterium]